MDARRFDLFARALATPTRRGLARLLTGLAGLGMARGPGALDGAGETAARNKHKKKRKKCKKHQKKCGKKCIPKGGCCPLCSRRETCTFGLCVCAPGTITCGDLCCVTGAEVCLSEANGTFRCLPVN